MKAGAVLVVAVSILPILAYFRSKESPLGQLLAPLLFISIACLPYVLNWYWKRHPAIAFALNTHGFWCSDLDNYVRWSDVERITCRSVALRYLNLIYLVVEVRDRRAFRPITPWLFGLKTLLNHAGNSRKLSIPINHLNEPPAAVVAAIRKFHPVEGSI